MTLAQLLKHRAVRGVCIGACPDGFDLKADDAHAHHAIEHGKYRGWICIRSHANYTATNVRHELAHIIRGSNRHDDPYWAVVRELGGRKHRYMKET